MTAGASAQNFEFGADGGLVDYSVHNVYMASSYADFNHYQTSVTAPILSARAMFVYKNYQFGMTVEDRTLSYKCDIYPDIMPAIADANTFQYTMHELPVKLFVNRLVRLHKFELYGGLSVAYVFSKLDSKIVFPPSYGDEEIQKSIRITASLQVGATYFFTRHLGINAEVACEENNFAAGPLDKNVFSFPVLVGVRYKL